MEHGNETPALASNLLIALDALLQEQNVTRAAQRAGVSQPAMSRYLVRLRRLFEDELLVREGNTLYPTPYAISLIRPVHEVIDDIRALGRNQAQFDAAGDQGRRWIEQQLTALLHQDVSIQPQRAGELNRLEAS